MEAISGKTEDGMSDHTPTPWTLEIETESYAGPQEGLRICIPEIHRLLHDSGSEWSSPEDWERDLANATFIVHACNSHETLVSALTDLVHMLDTPDINLYLYEKRRLENAKAALSQAQQP
jgi:hypothetical protein